MSTSLQVGHRSYELGSGAFLYAFFSTVAVRAERGSWGSRFPTVMHKLYAGAVDPDEAVRALGELDEIEEALATFRPDDVVWDFDHRDAGPPWTSDISPLITSLADYFVTSEGLDLLTVLREGLRHASESGEVARVA